MGMTETELNAIRKRDEELEQYGATTTTSDMEMRRRIYLAEVDRGFLLDEVDRLRKLIS